MKVRNEHIVLDGNKTGVCVRVISPNGENERWIRSKDNYTRLFKNVPIAEVTAKSIAKPGSAYEYFINVGNDKVFPLNDCQYVNKAWEVFEGDTKYIIHENTTHQVNRIGYIVFEEGDSERTNSDDGNKARKELFRKIRDIASTILYDNGSYSIKKVTKKNHELDIHVINTAHIHIITLDRLMDINMLRKNDNVKCLPFDKKMDRYKTFYVYISKDTSETNRIGSDEHTSMILDYIINDLNSYYPELNARFEELSIRKYLNVKEEYKDGKNCQIR